MLKGLKVKPKNTEQANNEEKKVESALGEVGSLKTHESIAYDENKAKLSEISMLIKQEKALSSKDYGENFLMSLQKREISDDEEETGEYEERKIRANEKSLYKIKNNCQHCIESDYFLKDSLIYIENALHVSLPVKGPIIPGHLIISPNYHIMSSTEFDENDAEDLHELKRKILRFYREEYGKKAIFVEYIRNREEHKHVFIDCFPTFADVTERSYMTVLQELREADDEWTDNRKIILVRNSIQGSIPQGFPFVYFDFAMEKGVAHVIENSKRFHQDFVLKILAESLGLDLLFIRRKTTPATLILLKSDFVKKWQLHCNE